MKRIIPVGFTCHLFIARVIIFSREKFSPMPVTTRIDAPKFAQL